jgi:Domain of unknown function (DUF4331)
MKKHLLIGALALGIVSIQSVAMASSHREAPAITEDPVADNTDVWAWMEPSTHSTLHVVAAYNPLEEPSGGPNFHKFSDSVLYEVHIARGPTSLNDAFTYQFLFTTTPVKYVNVADQTARPGGGKEFFSQLSGQTQTYTVTKIDHVHNTTKVVAKNVPVAPVNIGPRTDSVVYKDGGYTDAYAATFINSTSEGGKVFAGPRDDGFYVDLGGVFDLANLRAQGVAQDGVSGFNCHAIALDIPATELTSDGMAPSSGASDANTLGIWASASRKKSLVIRLDYEINNQDQGNLAITEFGPWTQVSRLGLPLINEAVIGIQDKDHYNASQPWNDLTNFGAYFLNPIIARDYEVVSGTTLPSSLLYNRTDIVDLINLKASGHNIQTVGDVLRVDLGLDPGFPNGRPLPEVTGVNQETDVTDILLSYLITEKTSGVSDGVSYNDKNYLGSLPWLALPWQGYAQGHGKPTP